MEKIKEEILNDINSINTLNDLNNLKTKYLGKKGIIAILQTGIKDAEDKKEYGKKINDIKNYFQGLFESKQDEINTAILNEKIEQERIDITLPATSIPMGAPNILEKTSEIVEDLFISLGFDVMDGPEIEEDRFNFELLNIPHDHPARDMQDSFYIDENTLMRTHTSPVQARTMKAKAGQPIKIICPGKVYRRDDDDATHSHQFAQIEGLVIDKNINLGNLKATLELFLKKMYGEKREVRLRSSYFPFTEPSVEVDISCYECGGKGCSVCKGTGWIEILGGGMVHPNVLRMSGYDPEEYQGFAFGIGIERVAMLRYGIEDIRRFYQNDVRFLKQFAKK